MALRIHIARSIWQIAFSAIVTVALVIQFFYGLYYTTTVIPYIEQFFSYFTILSNIFIAVLFAVEARNTFRGILPSSRFASVRGAAVFCILTTGIVYSLFLRGGPGHQGQVDYSIAWINSIFHYVVPTLVVLDWIIFPPKYRLNWSTIFTWLGLTIVYLCLVELAGLFTNTYPYFFLNPVMFRGYFGVLMASAIFLPFFLVFSLAVVAASNIQYRIRNPKKRLSKK
jgi:hypothetical protein